MPRTPGRAAAGIRGGEQGSPPGARHDSGIRGERSHSQPGTRCEGEQGSPPGASITRGEGQLELGSYEEIAEREGCTPKTVDNALQRVKRKVATHLKSREVIDLR